MELRSAALKVLCEADPGLKAEQARALYLGPQEALRPLPHEASRPLPHEALRPLDTAARLSPPPGPLPGRPARPVLVGAAEVPRRSPFTPEGRAALLHAICHIEFNAINLALDAIWRFPDMPAAYYQDWLQVAGEEALHFSLLRTHLQSLGHDYGDFPSHDGLWSMAERTAEDVLARMALVPRTLEARGLDATPPIQAKLRKAGDLRAVEILDVILRDEIGHVAIGNRCYRWLCAQTGQDPVAIYPGLVQRYLAPRLKRPFNLQARRAAGFEPPELAQLEAAAAAAEDAHRRGAG